MKKLLFSLLPAMFFSAFLIAQNPCNLLNSVTLNAPSTPQNVMNGFVLRMTGPQPQIVVDTNQWNYIVIVKDGSNGGKIFKNGQLAASGTYPNISYSWSRLDIGTEFFTGYNAWFKGFVDEVRISNVERTASEIASHYSSNSPFISDVNTIGLWHFDQTTGTTANSTTGTNGTIVNAQWSTGKFGNSLYYNGSSARTSMSMTIPTSNVTIEFWVKPDPIQTISTSGVGGTGGASVLSCFGTNTNSFVLDTNIVAPSYTWSTGQTGNSITVNPNTLPYVWVSNGSCRDTVFFNSQAATVYDTVTVTTYDTITTSIAVTDTLIINAVLSGLNPPNNTNTLQVYPNPARTHITIDNGNFALMNGYTVRINNTLGQTVFSQAVNQQQFFIDLSGWTGSGFYYLDLLDPQGNSIERKVIVVQ
jgi:hypothetical protein